MPWNFTLRLTRAVLNALTRFTGHRRLVLCVAAVGAGLGLGPNAALAATDLGPSDELVFAIATEDERIAGLDIGDIAQDEQGFVWFGVRSAKGGLARFDAYDLKFYHNDPADSSSISHDEVWVLEVDSHGDLWAGAVVGGLSRYNRATDDFTQFFHDPADPTSLPDNDVKSLLTTDDGTLWVGTSEGLARFDSATETFTSYFAEPDGSMPVQSIRSMVEDPTTGHLWLGTRRNGVTEFDPSTGNFTSYRHDPDDSASLSNDSVDAVYQDRSGTLWFGTREGLNRLDPATRTFDRHLNDPEDPSSIGSSRIWSILEDTTGRFWVGHDSGLDLFHEATATFRHLSSRQDAGTGVPATGVRAIMEDNSGAIWLASLQGGVSRLSSTPENFSTLRHDADDPRTLSSDIVTGLAADLDGGMWVTTQRGLDYWDGDVFTRYSHDPGKPDAWPARMGSVLVDGQNNLWIGTESGGLSYYRVEEDTFAHYELPAPGNTDEVFPLAVDGQGNLWLHSTGFGPVKFDGESFNFLFEDVQASAISKQFAYPSAAYAPPGSNSVWFAGKGLLRVDIDTGRTDRFAREPGSLDDRVNLAHSIAPAGDGTLWIGMTNGGSIAFDPETGEYGNPESANDGLPAAQILEIVLDDKGELWAQTPRVIQRYTPTSGVSTTYDSSDGLPAPHLTDIAITSNGKVFVSSSTEGLASFDPQLFADNATVPPVVLTEFDVFGDVVASGDEGVLSRAIYASNEVVLDHDQNFFAFTFSALNYDSPGKNQFRYMLEGLDDDWRTASADHRVASYTGLSPGTYTFRVEASNNSGLWNEEGVALAISIKPPWWRSTLAYAVYATSLAIALFAFVRWRTATVQSRNRALMDRLAERQEAQDEKDALLDALQLQVKQVESILETVPTGIVLLDENHHAVAATRVAATDLPLLASYDGNDGITGLANVPIDDLLQHNAANSWHELTITDVTPHRQFLAIARVIESRDQTAAATGWVLAWQDVTADRELQARANTHEKLAAIGRFTAGIAHDLNNVLSIIALNSDRLVKTADLDDKGEGHASQIAEQTEQASAFLRQILDYSRRSDAQYIPTNLNSVVQQLRPVLSDLMTPSTELTLEGFGQDSYWVDGDADQIRQILMNLVVNAADSGASNVTIEMSTSEYSIAIEDDATKLAPSSYVVLAVSDDGSGIPKEILGQIFEPFTTTKELGKGTGLGLSQVEGLVKQHGGFVKAQSKLGEGTTMVIQLPRAPSEALDLTSQEVTEEPAAEGGQTILLVEDNVSLLALFTEVLEEVGHTVLATDNGADALVLAEQNAGQINLVLTDFLMSNMNGRQLIERLHASGAGLPVILLTGLNESDPQIPMAALQDQGLVDTLRKPVNAESLLAAVSEALDFTGARPRSVSNVVGGRQLR